MTETMTPAPVLTLSCPDNFGIVAAVAGYLTETGCNIEQSAQFADRETGLFFMRVEFDLGETARLDEITAGFSPIARRFDMDWKIHDATEPLRTILMVSKFDHCLIDLLHRMERREFNLSICAVVSNHHDAEKIAAQHNVPFHFLPVTPETKPEQERALMGIVKQQDVELIVLARYMQVLSNDFCEKLPGRVINIHHSFLPSFKGAKPYHQAFRRGVKLIGATAHFVTADLDEGPIIEQEAERVDHSMTPGDLIRIGRDVERRALAQAVRFYAERRILMNDAKTVIFR